MMNPSQFTEDAERVSFYEVCRFWGVPPYRLTNEATYSEYIDMMAYIEATNQVQSHRKKVARGNG